MQGWRSKMEDSHISQINLSNSCTNEGIHIFGVFDGHGGDEVAKFVKNNFTIELQKSPSFDSGDIEKALEENFLLMDEILREPAGKEELRQIYNSNLQIIKENKIKELKEKGEEYEEKKKEAGNYSPEKNRDPKCHPEFNIANITGCTANVCVIDENQKKIYLANSGDSRAVLCKNGIAYAMSEDHTPDLKKELDRIYKAEGFVIDGRVKGKILKFFINKIK